MGSSGATASGTSVAFTDKSAWVTATAYVVGDIVTSGGLRYVAATAHTSGTFATDLAALKWVVLDSASATAGAAHSAMFRASNYVTNPHSVRGTAAGTTNQIQVVPLYIPRTVTLDRIGIETTVAASAGGVARLGLYASATGEDYPNSLLEDFGTVDTTAAAGLQVKTVSRVLTPGLYWMAVMEEVAASTTRRVATPAFGVSAPAAQIVGAFGVVGGYYANGLTPGAMPGTVPALTPGSNIMLMFARLSP